MGNSQEGESKGDRAKGHPERQEQKSWPHWSQQGVPRTRRWSEQVLLDATMKTPQYPSGFGNTKFFFFLREFINTVSVGW